MAENSITQMRKSVWEYLDNNNLLELTILVFNKHSGYPMVAINIVSFWEYLKAYSKV